MLLVTPWLYGGVFESSHVWIVGGVLLSLTLALPEIARRKRRLPFAFWLVLAAVGWGTLQVLPLPGSLVAAIAPGTAQLRAELLPANLEGEGLAEVCSFVPPTSYETLSLRPLATQQDLAWLVVAAMAFLVGQQLFTTRLASVCLLACVAVNGAALALFGLVQRLAWNGQIYWIGMVPAGTPFAAFGNRNNAAGYLNLCLATTVGLAIWIARRQIADRAPRRAGHYMTQAHPLQQYINAPFLALCFGTTSLAAAVLCTLSRGGGLSLMAGACVLAVATGIAYRRASQFLWLGAAVAAGIGLVAWVGMVDVLEARFLTLSEPERLSASGRLPNWLDTLQAVPQFPIFGVGLGNYRDIYLLYEFRFAPLWHYFAENQYVQAVIDAGIVGLALMLATLAAVTVSCWTLLSRGNRTHEGEAASEDMMLAQVGLFAVTTQAFHAVFDFGLYLPANLLLMATVCGAVSGAAVDRRRSSRLGLVATLVLWAAGAWASIALYNTAAVQRALLETDFSQTPTAATDAELEAAIGQLTPLAATRAGDAELHYQLAKLHTQRYRLARFLVLRAEAPPETSLDEVWEQTSTTWLHRIRYRDLSATSALPQDEAHDQLVRQHLLPAVHALLTARHACPLLAKVHLRLARLAVVSQPPFPDAACLTRAVRCEPATSYVRTRTGQLHAQAGRIEDACRDWREILAIDPSQLDVVLPWAFEMMNEDQIVYDVLPPQPNLLVQVSEKQFSTPDREAIQRLTLERTLGLLSEAEMPGGERARAEGRALVLLGQREEAVAPYERAVLLGPGELKWRYELALLLKELTRYEEAHAHAVVCSRSEPDNGRYRILMEDLVRLIVRTPTLE